jgi:hypothetical protein
MALRIFRSLDNSCPVCGDIYTKISGYEWDDIEKYHHSKKWGARENKICRYNKIKKCAEQLEDVRRKSL